MNRGERGLGAATAEEETAKTEEHEQRAGRLWHSTDGAEAVRTSTSADVSTRAKLTDEGGKSGRRHVEGRIVAGDDVAVSPDVGAGEDTLLGSAEEVGIVQHPHVDVAASDVVGDVGGGPAAEVIGGATVGGGAASVGGCTAECGVVEKARGGEGTDGAVVVHHFTEIRVQEGDVIRVAGDCRIRDGESAETDATIRESGGAVREGQPIADVVSKEGGCGSGAKRGGEEAEGKKCLFHSE